MASLYTQKDKNIRKTWFLFTGFFLVVIGVGWAISYAYGDSSILVIAVVFSVLMSFFSYWYSDKLVLSMSRAREIDRGSARELYNVVENLCITAGLPVPKIYIIDESAPNAFATGRDPEHAVVAVTTGLLNRLDRSELEGVIAHELSHIGNRDMLLSTVVIVLVGFISLLADFFLRSMFWGRGRRDSKEGGNFFILIGIVLAILSPIITRLMHLAISRKREFLADASGALLTRYPEGLASALEKISRDPTPLHVAQNTTAHLWFDDPFDKPGEKISWYHKMFMTHPPVGERIRALRGMDV
ncbi:MAG: zinc metalloprotease HtpX [Candidatus Harrisonbacteria bacterium CG10_big_fil_rev_8_21_14_0_10_40_38]|uniref:Protease HtpX homolog n=1 Tax=Candidatus Harrisonbacteria bacterium CG10_big_fil_rev_8_21_14_0_10_40_38 TaxID=1974583 RepID=A0A2H0USY3_9BACT|nr:MAG: zinc metalloprotease HtpX [Candidatus Harrisonbacteria bacterium CG10_big_fil_rev_8_21_14_0_10_40_38]